MKLKHIKISRFISDIIRLFTKKHAQNLGYYVKNCLNDLTLFSDGAIGIFFSDGVLSDSGRILPDNQVAKPTLNLNDDYKNSTVEIPIPDLKTVKIYDWEYTGLFYKPNFGEKLKAVKLNDNTYLKYEHLYLILRSANITKIIGADDGNHPLFFETDNGDLKFVACPLHDGHICENNGHETLNHN